MNSTPAKTPVQPTDDDKNFFESLLPIVKTLPIDTKLRYRCSVMNKLKELRALVYGAQNVPSTTVLMPIHQQDMLMPPQKRHAPTHTSANLNQLLCISFNQQQQTRHNRSQQQYSNTNLPTPILSDNHEQNDNQDNQDETDEEADMCDCNDGGGELYDLDVIFLPENKHEEVEQIETRLEDESKMKIEDLSQDNAAEQMDNEKVVHKPSDAYVDQNEEQQQPTVGED
ncbi:hypothetical protein RN001_012620 [Aquatica leii]|uniref:BESS domain-containing protein n=1 Tax=Aquatica leii TaxID=1421715 RepID=A0AAN7QFF2_9COLE|nr:hypothetical protein RN001_012620 [Aquatica leii]